MARTDACAPRHTRDVTWLNVAAARMGYTDPDRRRQEAMAMARSRNAALDVLAVLALAALLAPFAAPAGGTVAWCPPQVGVPMLPQDAGGAGVSSAGTARTMRADLLGCPAQSPAPVPMEHTAAATDAIAVQRSGAPASSSAAARAGTV